MVKRKTKDLYKCGVCRRPVILFGYPKGKTGKRITVMTQGPKVHPDIDKWCSGVCDAITCEIPMILSDVLDSITSKKRRRTIGRWAKKLMRENIRDIVDVIRERSRGK